MNVSDLEVTDEDGYDDQNEQQDCDGANLDKCHQRDDVSALLCSDIDARSKKSGWNWEEHSH